MKEKLFSKKRNKIIAAVIIVIAIIGTIFEVLGYVKDSAVPTVDVVPDNCYDRTITVVADYDYEPYSFIDGDGNMSGHDVELIYALANEMKVNVDLQFMNWNEAMAAIENGQADVILGIEYANEEASMYNLTVPFNNDQFLCFGKEDYEYLNELEGKRIATLDENKNYEYIMSMVENVDYDSYTEAFQALSNDEVDYVICRYAVGRRIVANLGDQSIEAVGPTLINCQLCMGVRKDDPALCDEINEATNKLVNDGYAEELSKEWLGTYVNILTVKDFISQYSVYFTLVVVIIVLAIIILLASVNSRMRKAKAISDASEMCIEILSKQTGNGIFEWDLVLKKVLVSVNFQKFMSIFEDIVGDRVNSTSVYEEDIETVEALKAKTLNGENIAGERFRLMDEDGVPHWYELTTALIKSKEGRPIRVVGSVMDANNRVHNEEQLKKKAELDLLTGIYNKVTAERMITHHLENSDRGGAMFLIDIDYLKRINDNLGHLYGDTIIKKAATDLRRTFRKNDIIGRVGGDEFIAFIEAADMEIARAKAKEICENYRSTIADGDKAYDISLSVGVAMRKPGDTYRTLFVNADNALYSVKKTTKDDFAIYGEVKI